MDGLVGVGELGVLAHDADPHPVARLHDLLDHRGPRPQVGLLGLEPQPVADEPVQVLLVQQERNPVDRLDVAALDHQIVVHVAEQRDLALDGVRQGPVRTTDEGVRLDTDLHQLPHRVLGGLGLELARGCYERHQRQVDEERVVAANLLAELPDGLEERE